MLSWSSLRHRVQSEHPDGFALRAMDLSDKGKQSEALGVLLEWEATRPDYKTTILIEKMREEILQCEAH